MTDTARLEAPLRDAFARLAGKGLIRAGDSLSERIPEEACYLLASWENGLGADGVTVSRRPLSGGNPTVHGLIYGARPDVGAVLLGSQPWGAALNRLSRAMPGIFDEQIRHLGVEVARISVGELAAAPGAALGNGANAYAFDGRVLCLGMGLERLSINAELLEKCAKAFVLADSSGKPVRRIPWLVRFIANGKLRKDRKEAAQRHLAGLRSIMKTGY